MDSSNGQWGHRPVYLYKIRVHRRYLTSTVEYDG